MKHLRVLFVSDKTDIVGGGEISLLHLISGLQAIGDFEPFLAVPANGELSDRARALNIPVVTLAQPRMKVRPWSLPGSWKEAGRVIGDIQPDIIHVNSARSMLIAGIAGNRRRIPVVWHVRVEGRDIFDRWLATKCTLIITPSRIVASRYPSAEVHVIPNPVPIPEIGIRGSVGEQLRAEYQQDDEFLLLTIGELIPRKGYHRLIEALLLLDPTLSWRLLICGRDAADGAGFRIQLEKTVADENLENRVHLLGFRDDVPELMIASDLLIHAPDTEGFGRVFIEAMAAGLPVVGTPAGGLKEIHEETGFGWISDDMSPAALARTVEVALRSEQARESFRRDGPGIAREKYSVEMHAGRVRDIYLNLPDIDVPMQGLQE